VGTPELVARVPFHESGDLDRFNRNLIENPRAANLTVHGPDEGHAICSSALTGLPGFAIDDTGDLQNVHNNGQRPRMRASPETCWLPRGSPVLKEYGRARMPSREATMPR
jgi:hypothetical protein